MSWMIFGAFWLVTDHAPWYVIAAFLTCAALEFARDFVKGDA